MMFHEITHPLNGWQPRKQSFSRQIQKSIDALALKLDMAREELDITLSSLESLDKAVRRKGRRRCLELDIFPSLIFYVGELIGQATNGQWEFRVTIEQKQPIWEPWIVVSNGNACPPHTFLYKELYEGRTCHIRSVAENEIRRLLSAPPDRHPSIPTIVIYHNDNNETLDGSRTQVCIEPEGFFFSSKVRDRVKTRLLQSLNYYRKLGFFAQYHHLSSSQLEEQLETIKQEFEQDFQDFQELHEFYAEFVEIDEQGQISLDRKELPSCLDLCLLRWDRSRTWSESEVRRVCPENQEYVQAIARWSEISRGAFLPQDVEELWKTRSEPSSVDFTLNGFRHHLKLDYYEEYIDLESLLDINRLIDTTGYKFRFSEALPNYRLVVVLTPGEEKKLQTEKNLYFY